MSKSHLLQPARLWAEQEMGSVPIGDRRRTKRLITVTAALAQNPSGTLPSTFPEWTDLRAAYRLFAQQPVPRILRGFGDWPRTEDPRFEFVFERLAQEPKSLA